MKITFNFDLCPTTIHAHTPKCGVCPHTYSFSTDPVEVKAHKVFSRVKKEFKKNDKKTTGQSVSYSQSRASIESGEGKLSVNS